MRLLTPPSVLVARDGTKIQHRLLHLLRRPALHREQFRRLRRVVRQHMLEDVEFALRVARRAEFLVRAPFLVAPQLTVALDGQFNDHLEQT